MPQPSLNVQCFVEKQIEPIFTGENQPKLLYVSEIRPDASAHPRVMHAHEDAVELILICSGSSEYLIHDKKTVIEAGDLLVYNAGVVHDEVSGPDMEVGSYCVGVGGLHMPGLRPNALIPDEAGYVFPTGRYFADMKALFEMMFRNLAAGEPRAELFCSSLMHALLVAVLTVTEGARGAQEIPADAPHILGRRIGEAQTLLITTELSVTRIAEMVGYDSSSYFNLQFTKNVGMPPNKYRHNYIVSVGEEEKPRRRKG